MARIVFPEDILERVNPKQKSFSGFAETEIKKLFGELAAEDEPAERLKKVFFKNETYDQIHNELPLRILVAHKGIGKSAILRVSYLENQEANILSLWIRPNDIGGLLSGGSSSNFLEIVRNWKNGLERIIVDSVMENFSIDSGNERVDTVVRGGVKLLDKLSSIADAFVSKYANADKAKTEVAKAYLKSKRIVIYIDDLDRGWQGTKENIIGISALLSAARDMVHDPNNAGLQIRISLRSDVYFLARTSDESTDKIAGDVIWLSWTQHQLLAVLVKRVQEYFGSSYDMKYLLAKRQSELEQLLEPIMETTFRGEGKWRDKPIRNVILSCIRNRPRDTINLCVLAARNARESGRTKIMTEDWQDIFDQYSQERLQDTINEHKYELPNVEDFLLGMKPNKKNKQSANAFLYTRDTILNKIRSIMQTQSFKMANGRNASADELLAFLYKIDFVNARSTNPNTGKIDRKFFEDHRYLSARSVDFGYEWEVHMAFRWALNPEFSNAIFSTYQPPED